MGVIPIAAREVLSNVYNLPRSIEERGAIKAVEAKIWLSIAQSHLPKPNAFFLDGEIPVLDEAPIGAGWFSTSFRFESDTGSRVIKISNPHVPALGHPNNSTDEHAIWYKYNLATYQDAAEEEGLPFLIPQPQEALYVSNGERCATLILQPYIHDTLDLKGFAALPWQDQNRIIYEYRNYERLSRRTRRENGILPDRLGDLEIPTFMHKFFAKVKSDYHGQRSNNLVIGKIGDGKYHLILWDDGFADSNLTEAPVVNLASGVLFEVRSRVEKGTLIATSVGSMFVEAVKRNRKRYRTGERDETSTQRAA